MFVLTALSAPSPSKSCAVSAAVNALASSISLPAISWEKCAATNPMMDRGRSSLAV
jgi:hypothetical protein